MGTKRTSIVALILSLIISTTTLIPQVCVTAQSYNDAVAYLDLVEEEVMTVAAKATQNFVATCDLVASCSSSCSRKACDPLEEDLASQTCKSVALNPTCYGPNGTLGCSELPVSLSRSYVRLSSPSNVSVVVAANYTICSQRMLDPTFINISNSHDNRLNLTTWVYFGSVEGVERSFPGRDTALSDCIFEPRKRPWYVGATAVKKDLVILLDGGNFMGETPPSDIFVPESKFNVAVNMITELLDTLTYGDRVSVIEFTSASTATLVGNTLTANINDTNLQPLKSALSLLSPDTKQGSSNLEAGFQLANQTFAPNTNNLKVILVITDGQFADSNLLSTVKPVLNSLVLQKVLVLLYSFDRGAVANASLSQVACYVDGIYERILKTVDNPLWTLRSYFGIIAYWRLQYNKFKPYWSKPYPDDGSLGTVITAAYPTFAPDNYTLIGVVGYDINLAELGGISVSEFQAALAGRASSDPDGVLVNPVPLPCNIQPSTLNTCPNASPPNPLCISNDTSNTSFEERVCACSQCQVPPTHAPATSISPVVIGAVAGGGGVLLVAIILTVVFCCWCSKRRKFNQMAVDQKASVVEPLYSGSPNSTSTKSTKASQKSARASYNTTSQEVDGPSSVVSTTGSKASDGQTLRGSKTLKAPAWPEGGQSLSRDLRCFSHEELSSATGNWSNESILGQGACGNVYKGDLDGLVMAIKKPHEGWEVASGTFDRELELLSKLNHRCLVRLLGYCEDERVLVYEFMENGTLEDCLHRNFLGRILTWEERLKIAVGASRGLEYLHDFAVNKIIHGDVKPANILCGVRGSSEVTLPLKNEAGKASKGL